MTAITVEQFLSSPSDPEDDLDLEQPAAAPGDPLASIADSLARLVGMVERHESEESQADVLRELHDDLDAKHAVLHDLVLEIEEIIKPSTSKLANTVREAIDRWRGVEPAPVEAPKSDEQIAEEGQRLLLDPAAVGAGAAPATGQPANDAHVFEWQAYARSLGHAAAQVDVMNRSQTRTLLGIEHGDKVAS